MTQHVGPKCLLGECEGFGLSLFNHPVHCFIKTLSEEKKTFCALFKPYTMQFFLHGGGVIFIMPYGASLAS